MAFTAEQIAALRLYVTNQGDIIEIDQRTNQPCKFVGHLEDLNYRYLVQCVALQFNVLTMIRTVLDKTMVVLEHADIDILSAGLQEAIGAVDLAQRAALDGPLSLFAEKPDGHK